MSGETHIALISGGRDSAVAAREAVVEGPCDLVAYLDTRTGLDENRRYCETLADYLGVQLWTLRTHESYEEKVMEHGFPGPSRHSIMYRSLKERQLDRLATTVNGGLHLWTGVRRHESDRRLRQVKPEQEADRWTWHAPIWDWTSDRLDPYIDEHGIPRNQLWRTLGRSGDCYCGCFGSREELMDLEAAGVGYQVQWIQRLEHCIDRDDETAKWAHGSLSNHEKRAERAEGRDMTLCSSCGIPEPVTDGGDTVGEEGRGGGLE